MAWFAQNADITHEKLRPVPIGLNCFEHAPEMRQAQQKLDEGKRTKLVFVNFGNTHPSRKVVLDQFCPKGRSSFATCSVKTQQNNIMGNPHLVSYYRKVAEHKYVVAPRGNGWDTHRLWEALYLGCIPIVGSSPLDPLYKDLPIFVVSDWKKVTPEVLQLRYAKFKARLKQYQGQLHRQYWWEQMEATRTRALQRIPGNRGNTSRFRCWG